MCALICLGSGFTSFQSRLIDVITAGDSKSPRGIAVKSASVYIARRWSPEIEVHEISDSGTINARNKFSLPACWRPDDLVASMTDSVVYMLGWVASNRQVVHKLCSETGVVIATWPVVKMPRRLSVDTGSQDVLLACQDGLRLYSSSGLLQSVIPLKVKTGSVWHALQIPAQASCSHFNRFEQNLCGPFR